MIEFLISYKWIIFLLFILWFFKDNVQSILNSISTVGDRAKNIKWKNFDLELGSEISSPSTNQQQYSESQFFNLQKAHQSSIVTNEEKIIANQIDNAKLTSTQAIAILTNHLANANVFINMLKIDKLIFLEQIWLLSFLNEQYKACTEHDLLPFYEQWIKNTGNKSEDYSYKNFLDYLLRERLIAQELEGYRISLMGREYLTFLIRMGRSISKNE